MKADLVLSPQSERLTVLAATANREHELTFGSAVEMLRHAILCGEALCEARRGVPLGQWEQWLSENVSFVKTTAYSYQRLALNKAEIEAKGLTTAQDALAHLRAIGAPGMRPDNSWRTAQVDVELAKLLRSQGLSYQRIADRFGVCGTTITELLDPAYKKRQIASRKRAQQNRQAARKALAIKQRDAAVKKIGGAAADAYALLRRCALSIDQAELDAQDADQREQLHVALVAVHRAEDAIVRALRIGRQS